VYVEIKTAIEPAVWRLDYMQHRCVRDIVVPYGEVFFYEVVKDKIKGHDI
jgi:hypothetical protein